MIPSLTQVAILSTNAQNFTLAHTTVIPTHALSPLDACPICLEAYTTETPLQITGIETCAHIIGQNCLHKFLAKDADKTKRCPLCRALWIRGSENTASAIRTRGYRTDQGSRSTVHAEETSRQSRHVRQRQEEQAARREWEAMSQDYERVRLRASQGRYAAPRLAVTETSSVRAETTTLNPYQALRLDVESVRARAANTEPRRWRDVNSRRQHTVSLVPATSVSSHSASGSSEPIPEEDAFEEYMRAIEDVRARAARTRPGVGGNIWTRGGEQTQSRTVQPVPETSTAAQRRLLEREHVLATREASAIDIAEF